MAILDDKYHFVKPLGEGGFGKVILAREKISNRLVAIKQLKNTDKAEQENIIQEIQFISKFSHKNIVSYYHHFFHDERLHLVMEYCSGGSLRDKLKSKELKSTDVMKWFTTLASTLKIVHDNKIIHHDIKPDNILFAEDGTIKISDFGVANSGGGTRAYKSPEALDWEDNIETDPRVDVYALGVTLMEVLAQNPFFGKSREQILEVHQRTDFPIKELTNWEQEIILKAINKVPELRFQTMGELYDAINAKAVPVIFNRDSIKAGELVDHADKALKTKKWLHALKYLELARQKYPNNVAMWRSFGNYYLLMQQIDLAKDAFEKALTLNPRLDLQKDLGQINLESGQHSIAISLLSEHLNKCPNDYEAYNLLLKCYFETGRYEPAMSLAKTIMDNNKSLACFANNYYISYLLHNAGTAATPDNVIPKYKHPIIDYNYSVVSEREKTYNLREHPTLKSKLLFMDFHFNNIISNSLTITDGEKKEVVSQIKDNAVVTVGREGYKVNDIQVSGSTSVSRRHCLIVNSKSDVWLFDLNSTGTYLNEIRVQKKARLNGVCKVKIGASELIIKTDKTQLI